MTAALCIADALDAYEQDRRDLVIAAQRMSRICRHLKRHIGETDAADRKAVAAAVKTFVAARRDEGMQDSTIRRELIVLRAALRHAWKEGDLLYCPYVGLPAPGAPGKTGLPSTKPKLSCITSICRHICSCASLSRPAPAPVPSSS